MEDATRLRNSSLLATSSTTSLSRDGRRLAAGTTTGYVRVWDLAGKPAPTHAFQHDGFVHAVAFNDDASRVASASMDRTARVWALSEKQRPLVFKHPDEVLTVAFCANGKALATGGKDRVVRLWSTYELYTPRPVEIAGHEGGGGVSMMAVSGDGRFMLTGGYEEVPRLWELDRLDPRVIELRGHGYQEMELLAVARQTRRARWRTTRRYELPSVWACPSVCGARCSSRKHHKTRFRSLSVATGAGLRRRAWERHRFFGTSPARMRPRAGWRRTYPIATKACSRRTGLASPRRMQMVRSCSNPLPMRASAPSRCRAEAQTFATSISIRKAGILSRCTRTVLPSCGTFPEESLANWRHRAPRCIGCVRCEGAICRCNRRAAYGTAVDARNGTRSHAHAPRWGVPRPR